LNAIEIAGYIGKSIRTTERYLQLLKEENMLEYRGSKKSGGYYLTKNVNDLLNE
jgi:ATP-dependent DNA helicase RecG